MSANQSKPATTDDSTTSAASTAAEQGAAAASTASGKARRKARKPSHKPFNFDDLHSEELRTISGTEDDVVLKNLRESSWGLALSGGGIRSATFALGVLQVLAKKRLLKGFHYLSTVSGGGYAGSMLQNLIARHGIDATVDTLTAQVDDVSELPDAQTQRQIDAHWPPESEHDKGTLYRVRANRPIRHLREYSNYLSPRTGLLSGDTLALIATYLRNLLLVQSQLLALMIALGALPLVLFGFRSVILGDNSTHTLMYAGLIAVLASIFLGVVSWNDHRRQTDDSRRTAVWSRKVATLIVAMLALACVVAAVGMAGVPSVPTIALLCASAEPAVNTPDCDALSFGGWVTIIYAVVWLGWYGMMLIIHWLRPNPASRRLIHHSLRYWAGTVLAAFIGGLLMGLLLMLSSQMSEWSIWIRVVLMTPLIFVAVATTASFHLGLVGAAMTELQREVWARIGGRTMAVIALALCASIGLLVFGPYAFMQWVNMPPPAAEEANSMMSAAGWIGALGWIGATLGGVYTAYKQLNVGEGMKARLASVLVGVAPWIFILGLWVLIGMLVQWAAVLSGWEIAPFAGSHEGLNVYLETLSLAIDADPWAAVWVCLGGMLVWVVFSGLINANDCSMNAFYRNRLVRCYLGAGNANRRPELITGFDMNDDRMLNTLVSRPSGNGEPSSSLGERPLYPLMGAALNLVKSRDLDWQNRKAGSFVMSPRFCGYVAPPGRDASEPVGDRSVDVSSRASEQASLASKRLTHSITLGQAMAISGAAVNSNMGRLSSPAITFLLTLFDARLGWWLRNYNNEHLMSVPALSGFSGLTLILEMLGITHQEQKLVHVSDGGHFENLGLYELVRRRNRFILCVDAGADPDREFFDLGNAVHKCRVDFGVDIQIDVNALIPNADNGHSDACVSVGRIKYPPSLAHAEAEEDMISEGILLYIKPGLCGDEPADVHNYARSHAAFPHQPTTDQFFDEAQIESYRRLGQHIAETTLAPVIERSQAASEAFANDPLQAQSKDDFIAQLKHFWIKPLSASGPAFSQHGKLLAQLFTVLREDQRMQTLDAQLYPGWKSIARDLNLPGGDAPPSAADLHTRLPGPDEFRASFFFCQELIQLMELIYLDTDLETTWRHPDNRRWINTFKHWTWVPMFRLTWVLSAQTYGARFVSFCETRLDAPQLTAALVVEPHAVGEQSLTDLANTLHDHGDINFAEHSILMARPWAQDSRNSGDDATTSRASAEAGEIDALYLLRYDWCQDAQMADAAECGLDVGQGQLSRLTMGLAARRGDTLVLFRVQDHLRRLGLGTQFMEMLVNGEFETPQVDQSDAADIAAATAIQHVDVAAGRYGKLGDLNPQEAKDIELDIEKLLKPQLLLNRIQRHSRPASKADRR